jgi:membrane protein implicated in regulation of membrane protease activity
MTFVATLPPEWQTAAALLVVAIAATWLVRRALRARAKPGCGGDCGCPTDPLKKKLRS